ncbi:Chemotaxis regulator - transmits chemoreceptor signals to flagelllar motor components CheY [Paramagnetospirillum magnetotacticum MS-1]|uniref:Chemotaxis regulator-transmits chemoreceptor signals to flagelllar motor components CheY n=1 Tax=Paramagnetospirillum magnetotacticum MS-1 TaxID=272627 RepID=A0A0C2YXC0_PARME|nr:response regulator [Paramagnetospirillum magnetotacticum]KIL99345.1 Chemotaxis regulator - transmits chemoreceptor signals to flagelllar motor components CheY [Paramagnetospirillum magnetotacticum MS-1]
MSESELRRIKVLLVDDEPFIRLTIRQILIQIGIPPSNVYEAENVKAAVGETLRVRPSVVLCDIHMPGDDGFAYVATLRTAPLPDVAAIPVVMLTSDSGEEAVMTAKGHKVAGYLVKPVSIGAVKKAIERALKVILP